MQANKGCGTRGEEYVRDRNDRFAFCRTMTNRWYSLLVYPVGYLHEEKEEDPDRASIPQSMIEKQPSFSFWGSHQLGFADSALPTGGSFHFNFSRLLSIESGNATTRCFMPLLVTPEFPKAKLSNSMHSLTIHS
jgi:hypothetical protein